MLKFIDDYKEFGFDSTLSVVDNISSTPIPEKEKILDYLKRTPKDGVRCSTLNDFVTKELLTPAVWTHSDGEYNWDDEEIYHFEKYNMKLNQEFIDKVLSIA